MEFKNLSSFHKESFNSSFLSGSGSFANFTHHLVNQTLDEEKDDTSLAIVIISIFLVVILCLFLFSCVVLFCWLFLIECQDSRRHHWNNRISTNINFSYSDSDSDSDIEYGIENRINKNKEIYEPKTQLLAETPLNKIVIAEKKNKYKSPEINCAICLEPLNFDKDSEEKIVQISCQHIYHQKCISNWYFHGITSVSKCPLCREEMNHTIITVDAI